MRASFSPQSELGPALMGLAPACALATHCTGHCSMSVAQGIKGPCGFDVILTFLPALLALYLSNCILHAFSNDQLHYRDASIFSLYQ